jgi:hypothetical protein
VVDLLVVVEIHILYVSLVVGTRKVEGSLIGCICRKGEMKLLFESASTAA